MDLIADILLAAAAVGASIYCIVLSRRLRDFKNLETGIGGAVAVLSSQVEELQSTLAQSQKTAQASADTLTELSKRAEETSKKLEIQIASLNDLPKNVIEENTKTTNANGTINTYFEPPTQEAEPMFIRHTNGAV
jgi:chromosome segregation ATPase